MKSKRPSMRRPPFRAVPAAGGSGLRPPARGFGLPQLGGRVVDRRADHTLRATRCCFGRAAPSFEGRLPRAEGWSRCRSHPGSGTVVKIVGGDPHPPLIAVGEFRSNTPAAAGHRGCRGQRDPSLGSGRCTEASRGGRPGPAYRVSASTRRCRSRARGAWVLDLPWVPRHAGI